MVYENCIIYGPYKSNQDGRSRIFLKWLDGKSTTISYAKFLIEKKLNRYLSCNEEVHHIDKNSTNDSIENLEVLKRSEHRKLHANKPKTKEFECPTCNKKFTLTGKKLTTSLANTNRGKIGPFCNRHCVGKMFH